MKKILIINNGPKPLPPVNGGVLRHWYNIFWKIALSTLILQLRVCSLKTRKLKAENIQM